MLDCLPLGSIRTVCLPQSCAGWPALQYCCALPAAAGAAETVPRAIFSTSSVRLILLPQVLLYDWDHGYPWSKTADGPVHPRITR